MVVMVNADRDYAEKEAGYPRTCRRRLVDQLLFWIEFGSCMVGFNRQAVNTGEMKLEQWNQRGDVGLRDCFAGFIIG